MRSYNIDMFIRFFPNAFCLCRNFLATPDLMAIQRHFIGNAGLEDWEKSRFVLAMPDPGKFRASVDILAALISKTCFFK